MRGQATIEFIFIILIVIVYIFSVTKPLIENAQGVIEDIENISKTNYATQQIVNTTNKIALLGTNSKETITLFIPNNSKIICQENGFSYQIEINKTGNNPTILLCPQNICEKRFEILEGFTINCEEDLFGYGIKKIAIEKIEKNKIKINNG